MLSPFDRRAEGPCAAALPGSFQSPTRFLRSLMMTAVVTLMTAVVTMVMALLMFLSVSRPNGWRALFPDLSELDTCFLWSPWCRLSHSGQS